MKRNLIILLMVVGFLTILNGESITLNSNDNNISLISSDNNNTVLELNIGSFSQTPLKIDGEEYYQISIKNEAETYEKGAPELPTLTRSIIIDNYSQPEIRIIDSEYREFKINVAPSKGVISRNIDPASIPYEFGQKYQKDEFYPSQISLLGSPYIMRNYRGVAVTFNPFQYNPQTEVLRVYTMLKVEVSNSSKSEQNVLTRSGKSVSSFDFLYQNHFLNYETNRYAPLDEFGSILVIAPQNYISTMQIYANWKIQKGIPTEIVDVATIGNNSTSIKNYIQTYYNNHPELAFVQIAGDAAQVASLTSGGGGADPMYALVSGSDNYPDIFIGRFSAENTEQLLTQVERTLNYERDLNTSATYLNKALGIASAEGTSGQGDNGESDIQHMNIIRTNLLSYNYTTVDQIYDPGASASAVATSLNSGKGHVNYIGHGSNTSWSTTGFSNTYVNNLTNVGKLPFIVSVACVNGNFVSTTCFAEAWLRATYNDEPTGAMAIYASSINQSWASPMRGQDEISQLLTSEALSTIGGLYYSGSCDMMDAYGTDGINMFKTWHIFGDASLQVRTDIPQEMTINHSGMLPAGNTTYSVSTGIADALVSLTYNNQILGSGYANSSGNITLTLSNLPTTPTDLTLTVTALNKVTVIEPVTMAATDGPYLTLADYSVNDANNNGLLEYGETASLNLVIENIGNSASSSGFITFSESDTYLTLTSSSALVSTINAEGSLNINNVINFSLANNIPNNHTITLSYIISAGGEEYPGTISLTGKSYDMEITEISIDDSSSGNGNNTIDAGETFNILVTVENNGEVNSPASTINIANASYITYNSSSLTIPAISAGNSQEISFTATASSSIPAGELVTFTANSAYLNGDLEFSQGFLAALLQIGQGTVTNASLPIEPYYGYTYSQSIYTASELNLGVSQINKIAYQYNGNSSWTDAIVIYMGNTTKTSFTSTSDWVSSTNLTQVYSGSFTAPATAGWIEIELDTPFLYDGTSNLVTGFDENTSGWHNSSDEFYCYAAGSNRSIYYYDDSTNPNPVYPVLGTVSSNNPNMRIFASAYSTAPTLSLNTNNIDFGAVALGNPVFETLIITNQGGETLTGTIRANNSFSIQSSDNLRSKKQIIENIESTTSLRNIDFSINSLQSKSYIISHSTAGLGVFNGSLAITSNDSNNQDIEIPIRLEVINPASISVNPQNIELTLQAQQTANRDLTINNTGDLALTCSLTLQANENRDVTEIFSANFDDNDLADWSIDYLYSADHTWHIADNYSSSSIDGSSFLFINSDAAGQNTELNDTIETPSFNISAYEEVTIEFDHYFNRYSEEIADVDFWTGSEWINIGQWIGESIGYWSAPSHFTYTLTNEGYSDVKLRFHYYDANWVWYWAIDNLLVSGEGTPAPQWVSLDSEFNNFTISPNSNEPVTLNFNTFELEVGQYTATLNIQSNSATNSSIDIPITLTISELENEPTWEPVIYPNNSVTIYAEVTHLSNEIAEDDIVSAWVGDECRGIGSIVLFDRSQAFTTIIVQSNGTTENVYFKLYDRSQDIVIEESNSTTIASGQVVGSEETPFPINIGIIELIVPNNLDVEISNSIATINWLAVPNADFYKVFYSSDLENWTELSQVSGTSYEHTQPRSEVHLYKVKAFRNERRRN